MKEIYRLSEFERGDFYFLSNKIILNQTIRQKDFSECSIRQVNFSNCIFDWTSFPCTKCEDLTFEGCILQNASFKKSELENCIFKNCQLTNINFARSDLMNFDFINCKLNDVYFSAGQLTDLKFDNSQLQDVWFSGSLLDNVKIKNSTLEKIRFDGAEVYKETYKNGVLITNRTPINDYTSFLKEIDISVFNKLDSQQKKLDSLIYGKRFDHSFQKYSNFSLEDIAFFETMLFLTILTLIVYYFLKPESFDFFSNFVK